MVGLRASDELRAAIEVWASRQPDQPSLSEAIRRLVEQALDTRPARKDAKARAAGDAYAHKAAAEQIDRSLKGQGHSDVTKAERKSRLLKAPSNAKPKGL